MKVKINDQLICIPPYISAQWSQIAFIESYDGGTEGCATLKLHLVDGETVSIPNLDQNIINEAFQEHLLYLESLAPQKGREEDKIGSLLGAIQQVTKGCEVQIFPQKGLVSMLLGGSGPIDMLLQHSPEHKDHPDLPIDLLEKLAQMMRSLSIGSTSILAKPEPHCNCLHCQIGRIAVEEEDIEVSEEDLTFRSWDISQYGEKMYTVTDPLNPEEQFNVYLGTPIGCTCGQPYCEHVKAVLYT
ncbi:hypothetical protein C6H88_01480 [Chlamydia muridarum str. Nigg]|jgi:hypothetical protein|uniref:SWIM-type domain-containing protein n=2 Tax=Chlamydia muridarum TaxID=83560 RepID=A0A069ZWL9_CHLMR|nr:hypothetical protein [Chlamydia muridarum]AAF39152.1 conserved hypothetical protein [Chlamydia muridarum str. Nigg]AHH22675.1 hypothetical protein TAC_01490 [Chlamydia muridarum str. Nigg3 CMUT3-5]AHH23599.1 hypothetical protein Y015_01490 [Chlamydia muridarum str. Nigg CM972]AID37820.1 hypothetical protein BB17_01525 [Chlamydia muridarum str. Nigg 2 MCR]AIT90490.1 hypothetical protein NC80_01420 [Chlamydia muridarum]